MEKLIKLRNEAENWMQETDNCKTNLDLIHKELEQLKESKRDLEKELQITKQKLEEYQNLYQKESQQPDSQRTLPPLPPLPQYEILRPTTLTQISIQDFQVPLQTQSDQRKTSKKKKLDVSNKPTKKNAKRKSLATSLQEMEITYSQLTLYEEKDVNEKPKHWDAQDNDHREPKFKVHSQRVKSTYLKKQKQQIFNHTEQPHLQLLSNNTPTKTFTNDITPSKSSASVNGTVLSTPITPITVHTCTESDKKKQRYVKSLHLQAKIMDAQNGKKKFQKQKLKSHPKNSENDSFDDE